MNRTLEEERLDMTFSEELQRLRKAQGLSQEMLAEKCGVTRQSVSKWETGSGYPEMDNLLMLCELFGASADSLLRDAGNANSCDEAAAKASPFNQYLGKWVQVFLKDKESNGFYCVALVAIERSQLLFMDDKRKAILIDASSLSSISNFAKEKQMAKLPSIPNIEAIADVSEYFLNKKCDIKLKQENPLFEFIKPGGLYSVIVDQITDFAVTVRGKDGESRTAMMSDVLFIREK